MKNWLFALSAVPILAGCVATRIDNAASTVATTVNFICERNETVSIGFAGGNATLTSDGQTVTLTQQSTGSGFAYSGDGHEIRGKGQELKWRKPDGVSRSCKDVKLAMSQPQIEEPVRTLANSKWKLVHFQSSDDAIGTKVPPRVERYTMEFMSDGRVALQLDCNRALSQWAVEPASARGGGLRLTGGPMTRALCQPGAMDVQIANDLERVRSYTFAGDRLGLALEADAGIYLWEPLE